MQYFKYVVISLLLLLFSLQSQSQGYRVKTLDKNMGLSSNYVNCVIQDRHGYIWIGTRDGLNRYDGYTFKVYTSSLYDTTALYGTYINTLYEDRNGVIWIGTQGGGLSRYNQDLDNFTNFIFTERISDLPENFVRSIYQDSKGNHWTGLSHYGLIQFDPETGAILRHIKHDEQEIVALYEDQYNNLWVGANGGVYILDYEHETLIRVAEKETSSHLIGVRIKNFHEDKEGNIWLGLNNNGIVKFSTKDKSAVVYTPQTHKTLTSDEIQTVFIDSKNNFWIATINGGLQLFDREQDVFINFNYEDISWQGVKASSFSSIIEDRNGNVLFGTHGAGLNIINVSKNYFAHYTHIPQKKESLSYNIVSSFYEFSDGTIWVGTDGGGINVFNKNNGTFHSITQKDGLPSNAVVDLEEEDKSNIWVASWAGGVGLFNTVDRTIKNLPVGQDTPGFLGIRDIKRIKKDSKGRLWIATHGDGINVKYPDSPYIYRSTDNPMGVDLSLPLWGSDVLEDSHGDIWFASYGGLFRLRENTLQTYKADRKDENSIASQLILCIYEDSKKNILIGTNRGLELYHKDTDGFRHLSEEYALLPKTIRSIEEDSKGNLWISSTEGLTRFNLETGSIHNYDKSDGLQSNEFFERSSLKSSTGEMYFGGTNGFNVFYPDSIKTNPSVPPVYLTDFQIFNVSQRPGHKGSVLTKDIGSTREINLRYDHNVISLSFVALDYMAPEKNQYAYKLEGFDKDWNYVGDKRTATYTNLDPGTYTFFVKASNNDGIWNEEGTSISIVITPPFWNTWWFNTLVVLAIGGLAFAFIAYRVNSINNHRKKLQSEVTTRTAELRQTAANLTRINKELDQFAYIISHDLKAPLRGINNLSEWIEEDLQGNINSDTQQKLTLLRDRVDRMEKLIEGVLHYSRVGRTEERNEEINVDLLVKDVIDILGNVNGLTFKITSPLPVVHFNKVLLDQVFSNLVGNAVKYHNKPAGKVLISYRDEERFHIFAVEDDGPGIAPEYHEKIFQIFQKLAGNNRKDSTGIGLAIVKKIIEEAGGSLWIESDGKSGSTFFFTIAKNKK